MFEASEMIPIDEAIAKRIIELIHTEAHPPPGDGDLVFKFETTSGKTREGLIVERDGESSRDGVLLNDNEPPIKYEDIRWIAFGHGL